jgi:hypothetical protein
MQLTLTPLSIILDLTAAMLGQTYDNTNEPPPVIYTIITSDSTVLLPSQVPKSYST